MLQGISNSHKKMSLFPHSYAHSHLSNHNDDANSHDVTRQHSGTIKSPHLANTYRMSPDKDTHFHHDMVENIMKQVMHTRIGEGHYDAGKSAGLSMEVATEIKNKVKQLGFERYKLVSQVFINSLHGQGMRIASRFVWDERFDNYVCYSYRNTTLCVVAVLFGIYLE